MKTWWHSLKKFFLLFVYRRTHEAPVVEQNPPAPEPRKPDLVPMLAMDIPPPPDAEPSVEFPNRRARRAWERERRKRDRFVKPNGPTPISIPRGPSPRKPIEPALPQASNNSFAMEGDDGTVYAESEIYGLFNFRDTILDQLERYWIYLRRMKHNDPDSYAFYSTIGATIAPLAHWFLQDGIRARENREKPDPLPKLSPWWREHRPAFGCVAYGISSMIEAQELNPPEALRDDPKYPALWVPKFLYFTKYSSPPPEVQPTSGGDVYRMTVWWDRPHDPKMAKKMKGGQQEEYAVFVDAKGEDVHVLPMLKTNMIPVRERKNGLAWFNVPQRAWSIPRQYVQWAKRHNQDANTFLSRLFVDAAHSFEQLHYSMVRVAVKNGDLTAVFGVEVKRIPYFFQDRDITLTEGGVKRRIFHIVRAYERKDGRAVRFHFAGEKEFTWAGYQVKITVPARDHFDLAELDIGVVDSFWMKKGERNKYLFEPEYAKHLAKWVDEGVGRYKAKR